jgi:hypothetical protein
MLAAPVMVRGLEACFVNRYWCCSRCFKRRVIVRNHNTLSAVLIPYLISSATRHTGVTNVGDLCGVGGVMLLPFLLLWTNPPRIETSIVLWICTWKRNANCLLADSAYAHCALCLFFPFLTWQNR